MTTKEQRFWQIWLTHWGRPQHSSNAAIAEKLSPYIPFSEWLNEDNVSMEQVEAAMLVFAREEHGPKYSQIQHEYNRRTGRRRNDPDGPPREVCRACEGTPGWITVPRVQRGKRTPVIRDRAEIRDGELVYATPAPCKCSAGQRANSADDMGYSEMMIDRLFACRVTASAFHTLSHRQEHAVEGKPGPMAATVASGVARAKARDVGADEAEWRQTERKAEQIAAGIHDDDF